MTKRASILYIGLQARRPSDFRNMPGRRLARHVWAPILCGLIATLLDAVSLEVLCDADGNVPSVSLRLPLTSQAFDGTSVPMLPLSPLLPWRMDVSTVYVAAMDGILTALQ